MTSGLEAGDLRLEAGEGEERFLTLTAGSEWRCLGLGRGKERRTRKFGAWGTRAYGRKGNHECNCRFPRGTRDKLFIRLGGFRMTALLAGF